MKMGISLESLKLTLKEIRRVFEGEIPAPSPRSPSVPHERAELLNRAMLYAFASRGLEPGDWFVRGEDESKDENEEEKAMSGREDKLENESSGEQIEDDDINVRHERNSKLLALCAQDHVTLDWVIHRS
jgi:hypothetical protein